MHTEPNGWEKTMTNEPEFRDGMADEDTAAAPEAPEGTDAEAEDATDKASDED